MEALWEEFKPVALENHEFSDRRNTNVKWKSLHFRSIENPIEGTHSEIVLS